MGRLRGEDGVCEEEQEGRIVLEGGVDGAGGTFRVFETQNAARAATKS